MNNADFLASLPQHIELFNNIYNRMLVGDADNTVIFKTAVDLRNNILSYSHEYYKIIISNFEAGSLEDKFKACQLWDSNLRIQLEDIKNRTGGKYFNGSGAIYREIKAYHPDIFNKKFASNEHTSYSDHAQNVSNLKDRCRQKYMDVQQSLRDDPNIQEAYNRFNNQNN
jgi:hypothetical protein